jgi:hypothetical protein
MFCFCSNMPERLPPPWTVRNNDDSYWVEDARGQRFAFVYFRDRPVIGTDGGPRLSRDLARRISANVARLPDLLRALDLVNWRQQNTGKDGF